MKQKQAKVLPELVKLFELNNTMAAPRLTKVVVNAGFGSRRDKARLELVSDRLSKITGQKVAKRQAKQSIASFKLREGEVIGASATLRGARMFGFLDKLVNVAIPRTRDFRGLSARGIDEMGNYTMGVKEHLIFPETADEDVRDVFGFSISIGTSAKNKEQAEALLRALGFPFKAKDKDNDTKKVKKAKKK